MYVARASRQDPTSPRVQHFDATGISSGATLFVQVLQDGLVHLPSCLSLDVQQWLVDECMRLGNGDDAVGGGFYGERGFRCVMRTPAPAPPPRVAAFC